MNLGCVNVQRSELSFFTVLPETNNKLARCCRCLPEFYDQCMKKTKNVDSDVFNLLDNQ